MEVRGIDFLDSHLGATPEDFLERDLVWQGETRVSPFLSSLSAPRLAEEESNVFSWRNPSYTEYANRWKNRGSNRNEVEKGVG